jgi:hypothetical protein
VSARNDSPEPFCEATCGNGTVEAGEACDDGITRIEIGFICNFSEVANGEKIQTKKSVKSV